MGKRKFPEQKQLRIAFMKQPAFQGPNTIRPSSKTRQQFRSIKLNPAGGREAYQNRKLLQETDVASALLFLQWMWGSFCLPSQIRVTRKRKYRRDTPLLVPRTTNSPHFRIR